MHRLRGRLHRSSFSLPLPLDDSVAWTQQSGRSPSRRSDSRGRSIPLSHCGTNCYERFRDRLVRSRCLRSHTGTCRRTTIVHGARPSQRKSKPLCSASFSLSQANGSVSSGRHFIKVAELLRTYSDVMVLFNLPADHASMGRER